MRQRIHSGVLDDQGYVRVHDSNTLEVSGDERDLEHVAHGDVVRREDLVLCVVCMSIRNYT